MNRWKIQFSLPLRITAPYRYASAQGLARPAANSLSVTRLHPQTTCQSLTSRRDSGSGNFGKSSSLCEMSQKYCYHKKTK
ncbi:hypothetical protein EHQ99_19160 [Leptospira bouyouniensis]|nr:hypothetical protein EHQ99_19160 [Leptospira bouyouniensis]